MKELITAIGLLLFIEGILYALFPSKMKNMLKILDKLPINQLRITGLFFAFYRAMQAYEKALIGGETSLILSPDSDFFKFFGNTGVIKN